MFHRQNPKLQDDKSGEGQTSYEAALVFQARHGDDIINQSTKSLILISALYLASAIHILSQLDQADQASY